MVRALGAQLVLLLVAAPISSAARELVPLAYHLAVDLGEAPTGGGVARPDLSVWPESRADRGGPSDASMRDRLAWGGRLQATGGWLMVGGFAVFVVAGVCLIADIMQGIEGKSPGGLCGAAPALAISGLAAVLGGTVTLAVGTVLRYRALSDWRAAHPERPAGP